METKKLITPIGLALLLVFGFYSSFYPLEAQAQTFQVISGFAQPIIAMHYQSGTDTIWVITEGSGKTLLYEIDRSTKSVVATYNHTQNFDNLALGGALDIWCGLTDCFVTTTTGGIAKISTVDISPNIFKGQNVTATVFSPVVAPFYHITGRDEVSGGFGTITMWVDGCSEAVATCDGTFRTVDGISMTIVSTASPYATSNNGAIHAHDMQWSGIAGVTDNHFVTGTGFTTDTAATNLFRIYDLTQSPILQSCSVALPSTNNVYDIATNYVSAGSSNNKIYVGSANGNMYVLDDSCTLLQSISASDTGLSGDIRFIEYSGGKIFMQEDGGTAKISQLLVNSTGHVITTGEPNIYFPLPSVSQPLFMTDGFTLSHSVDNMILLTGNGQLWFPYSSTEKEIGILTYDSTLDEPPQEGRDCDLPENANILICRLGGNGEIGSAGAFVIGNVTTGTGILGIGCSSGWVDCTEDPDPKTNGLGLLIFIASIFVVVGMFWFSIGKEAFHLPIFIWVLIIISLSAFFTLMDIIDPVFLILSVVACIALAVPKVIGLIQSRGSFGGGSSE